MRHFRFFKTLFKNEKKKSSKGFFSFMLSGGHIWHFEERAFTRAVHFHQQKAFVFKGLIQLSTWSPLCPAGGQRSALLPVLGKMSWGRAKLLLQQLPGTACIHLGLLQDGASSCLHPKYPLFPSRILCSPPTPSLLQVPAFLLLLLAQTRVNRKKKAPKKASSQRQERD